MSTEELPIDPVPGPVDKALEPKVEDPAPQPRIKFFVIERPNEAGNLFLAFNGGVTWTSNPKEAMRFSRPEDAKAGLVMFPAVPPEAHVAQVELPA